MVALILASAVLFYRLTEGVGRLAPIYAILAAFFVFFGFWLLGRLLYYIELSGLVQHFMGLSQLGHDHSGVLKELMKKRGLANLMVDTAFARIRYRLLRQVDEDFKGLIDISLMRMILWKACLITFANFFHPTHHKRYRQLVIPFFS